MENAGDQKVSPISPCKSEAEFKSCTVMHSRFNQVLRSVRSALAHPGDDAIVLIVGPTGVGKSRLLNRLKFDLTEAAQDEMLVDPGFIPVLLVEARKPDSKGPFNWREYYDRILFQAQEVLIDKKLEPDRAQDLRTNKKYTGLQYASKPADLRFAVEQCLRYRRVKTLLTDEAQSLTVISTGRKLVDQMDNIKSLSNLTSVTHTLAATYEGLALIQLSDQLCRRITVIEFPRYLPTTTDDIDIHAFQDTLKTFQQILPLQEPPDLLAHMEYLFVNSLGCVGTLKGWLEQALGRALESQSRTLTLEHLEQTVKPPQSILKMYEAIETGERRMQELHAVSQDALRALLGLSDRSKSPLPPDSNGGGNSDSPQPSGRKRPHPGQRAPSRDTIGGK